MKIALRVAENIHMPGKRKGAYMISVVAERYDIHPQTLRLYEREGLLKPSRTEGNTRLYTDEDLERLEVILNLTRDLGVNLAGVEIIINMREKMEQIQKEVNELLEFVQAHLREDAEAFRERFKNALVRVPPTKLVKLEKAAKTE